MLYVYICVWLGIRSPDSRVRRDEVDIRYLYPLSPCALSRVWCVWWPRRVYMRVASLAVTLRSLVNDEFIRIACIASGHMSSMAYATLLVIKFSMMTLVVQLVCRSVQAPHMIHVRLHQSCKSSFILLKVNELAPLCLLWLTNRAISAKRHSSIFFILKRVV